MCNFELDTWKGTRGWIRGQLRMSWKKWKGAYKEVNRDDYCSKGTLRRKLEMLERQLLGKVTAFLLCITDSVYW